jgi:hypothetical protein
MKRLSFLLAALCVTSMLSVQLIAQENGHKKVVVIHKGKVTKFERLNPAYVVVKTDKGEINAELAPMTFIEENKLIFSPDDDLTVKGYETMRDGKRIFIATEVTTKDNRTVRLRGDDFNPVWTKVTTTTGNGATTETVVTYTGKVRTFERRDPAMVVLNTDKGEIMAELAPLTFVEENKLIFAPDDEITVKGYETMRDGKRIFIVTEVTTKDRRVVKLRTDARTPVWTKVTTTERPAEIRDITGAVTVVDTTDSPDGRLVTIRSDSGERVIALGPGTYLEKNKYVLTPGETINVKGWEVDRGGRRVFLATELKKGDNLWKFRRADGTVLWTN